MSKNISIGEPSRKQNFENIYSEFGFSIDSRFLIEEQNDNKQKKNKRTFKLPFIVIYILETILSTQ